MRKRYVQIDGELIEVGADYQEPVAPTVWGDIPAYESPVSGRVVEGRAARREDFKRTGSRPWEGMEQEKKEAARKKAYAEAKFDQKLDAAAWTSYYQMSPDKRRKLLG